ncbi:hypothetical protein [Albidovulum sp.]|uniref:hypothetical protein n=1 Tax=Albidovulum sp. TaxID=1872424 RepID=UPI0039B99226
MGGFWRSPRPKQPEKVAHWEAEPSIADEYLRRAHLAGVERGLRTYEKSLPRRIAAMKGEKHARTVPGALTEDEGLRRQCLEWAFQHTIGPVGHMDVVNVARDYYDFIRNTQPRQDQVAWEQAPRIPDR